MYDPMSVGTIRSLMQTFFPQSYVLQDLTVQVTKYVMAISPQHCSPSLVFVHRREVQRPSHIRKYYFSVQVL